MISISGKLIKSGLKWHRRITKVRKSNQEIQEKTLSKLLLKAQDTDFGRKHGFGQILSSRDLIAAYQSRVPLTDYDSLYAAWWHRMVAGEPNVCWPGKVEYFALSSGTSGSPSKYIPVSKDMIEAMRKTNTQIFAAATEMGFPDSFFSKQMLAIGSTINLRQEGPIWVGDVSGINARHIPTWFFNFYYKPGKQIAQLPTWEARINQIVEEAHDWDIGTLCGIPSWVQLLLEKLIAKHKLKNIHELWPNLQVFVSGGVAFAPYRRRFEELMGKPMVYLDTYYTSEGCLGGQTRIADNMPIQLVLNNGIFFEFIPFNDQNFPNGQYQPSAPALHIGQVQEGSEYALAISTCAGTWRYLIGDTVRVTNKAKAEIVITGRIKQFLSICGEHLSIDNMNQAIIAMEQQYNCHLPEFTVKAVAVQNHYEHHWFVACDQPPTDEQSFAQALDAYIAQNNDDYATERRENLLRGVRVQFLPSKLFYDWFASKGKMGGQSKFPRVMNEQQYADWTGFLAHQGYEIKI
jgi:phenylacetate-coenzyme A ligase PaaK-like adenylate-forming protein